MKRLWSHIWLSEQEVFPLSFSAITQSGFSTILALLLTGFLVTLAAGVLFLFLSENRINQSLFAGTAAYHAAEGSMEYAMLKLKNHREGFADALVFGGGPGGDVGAFEGNRIGAGFGLKAPRMGYDITSGGGAYTGTLAPESFAIVPLFREKGKDILTQGVSTGKIFKSSVSRPLNPTDLNSGFWNYVPTPDISLQLSQGDALTWNVIGNKLPIAGGLSDGATRGISGRVSRLSASSLSSDTCMTTNCAAISVGGITGAVLGNYREYDNWTLAQTTKSISNFLAENRENYLVLYNPGASPVDYALTSTGEFTFPTTRIRAVGKVRDSLVQLELNQEKSDVYDILKYSLFVGQ